MRILLIGATGQLGGDIIRNNRDFDIVAPDRKLLDLLRPEQLENQVRSVTLKNLVPPHRDEAVAIAGGTIVWARFALTVEPDAVVVIDPGGYRYF